MCNVIVVLNVPCKVDKFFQEMEIVKVKRVNMGDV